MKKFSFLLLIGIVFFLSGCARYNEDFIKKQDIKSNEAVVIMGLSGLDPLLSMTFCSDDNCDMYEFGIAKRNDTVVVKVTVPAKNFRLEKYKLFFMQEKFYMPIYAGPITVSVPAFSVPKNLSSPVEPIDILESGVYYFGTLDTDNMKFDRSLDEKYIDKAKYFYAEHLSHMKTINFRWKEGMTKFEKDLDN